MRQGRNVQLGNESTDRRLKMHFSINVDTTVCRLYKNIPYYKGMIIAGDFRESLDIILNYWSLEDYRRQWREAIDRLRTHDTSCFVTSIAGPKLGGLIIWPLYKQGEIVTIQNYMYGKRDYKKRIGRKVFNTQNCYEFVPKYVNKSQCGRTYSEWRIALSELLDTKF